MESEADLDRGDSLLDADQLDPEARAAVELIDLGCGTGRSLRGAARRFGARGIGLERNERKVRIGQAEGIPIYRADLLEMDLATFPNVRYVTIDNVLEHLPTLDAVEDLVAASVRLASHVVHIRHPSFEDVDYLADIGLKQYWTDWPGVHTAPARIDQLIAMANRAGVYRVMVHPIRRAIGSTDPTILPLAAPPGQHRSIRSPRSALKGVYQEAKHGPKPDITFDRPVYFAFDILLVTGPDLPTMTYREDPEVAGGRPWLTWPDAGPALDPAGTPDASTSAAATPWPQAAPEPMSTRVVRKVRTTVRRPRT